MIQLYMLERGLLNIDRGFHVSGLASTSLTSASGTPKTVGGSRAFPSTLHSGEASVPRHRAEWTEAAGVGALQHGAMMAGVSMGPWLATPKEGSFMENP